MEFQFSKTENQNLRFEIWKSTLLIFKKSVKIKFGWLFSNFIFRFEPNHFFSPSSLPFGNLKKCSRRFRDCLCCSSALLYLTFWMNSVALNCNGKKKKWTVNKINSRYNKIYSRQNETFSHGKTEKTNWWAVFISESVSGFQWRYEKYLVYGV